MRRELDEAARVHGRHLWSVCYRMTGVAADADELVQETYARALAHPPEDHRALRPWLVRVAVNLARDRLRRRRLEGYHGVWLPGLVETDESGELAPPGFEPYADGPESTAGRYDLLESVSFAFLLALEALTPRHRAVLLLRDVFDYTTRETARALGITEDNAKTTLVRARRAMAAYDRERRGVASAETTASHRDVLDRLLGCFVAGDVAGVEALLADDVRAVSDSGGYHAANVPVVGRRKVAGFFVRLAALRGTPDAIALRMLNGLPTVVLQWVSPPRGEAGVGTLAIELDARGRIAEVYSVLADRKLAAIA